MKPVRGILNSRLFRCEISKKFVTLFEDACGERLNFSKMPPLTSVIFDFPGDFSAIFFVPTISFSLSALFWYRFAAVQVGGYLLHVDCVAVLYINFRLT